MVLEMLDDAAKIAHRLIHDRPRQLRIGAGHTNIINYSPDHILDVEGVRKDGSRVPLDAMLKPIRDASGLLREGGIGIR